jgi:hypothetical protein
LLLTISFTSDRCTGREETLFFSHQVLCLHVVILNLLEDNRLFVVLGTRDTFNVLPFLLAFQELLLTLNHQLPLTVRHCLAHGLLSLLSLALDVVDAL